MKKIALVLIVLLSIIGCKTTRNISQSPTIVPMALTKEDVEFVILSSLKDSPKSVEVERKRRAVDTTIQLDVRTATKAGAAKALKIKAEMAEALKIKAGATETAEMAEAAKALKIKAEMAEALKIKAGATETAEMAEAAKALGNKRTVYSTFNKSRTRTQYWHYEGKMSKDTINAGFHYKKFYMQVEIKYNESNITFKIINSTNLNQSERSIHRRALIWLNVLERNIRADLGKYDRMKIECNRTKK